MTNRTIPLLVVTLALSAGPAAAQAVLGAERDEARDAAEERSPEPEPTPLFCTGTGPHSVCVPPW